MGELVESLNESYPATVGSLAAGRRAVIALAASAGATEEQLDDVRLAVSEAMTNVLQHAYPGTPGAIHLTAALAGDELWLLVADDGAGLRPNGQSPGLGLGLALIAQATDGLTIVTRAGGGTELRMRFRLAPPRGSGGDQSRVAGRDQSRGARRTQSRGSVASASSPAASVFSTTA